jgi:hypothetical protein
LLCPEPLSLDVDRLWSTIFASPVTRFLIRTAAISSRAGTKPSSYSHTDLPYVAVNKDAFPTSPACIAGRIKSFRLSKQAQVSSVIFQAQ